jgi:hypothetical protein
MVNYVVTIVKILLIYFCRHIEEDSRTLTAEDLARMSPEELEFYYFSAHDFDKNIKLDGLELLKVIHSMFYCHNIVMDVTRRLKD